MTHKQRISAFVLFTILALIGVLIATSFHPTVLRSVDVFNTTRPQPGLAFQPFTSSFQVEEVGSMAESNSSIFWVSSGGRLTVQDNVAQTIQGDLPASDRWRSIYNQSNPTDTDNGLHPQNIFRLVARNVWTDARQDLYYNINALNLSTSPNRNASNGIFMMQRYKDANNLYYTGIRVDGYVVVKKKIAGTYYTMGSARVFDGTYNRDTNPNLLPTGQWMGFRTDIVNNTDGTVTITVYTDPTGNGTWTRALSVTDDGVQYGGAAFTSAGYSGLRTDFDDVSFRSYQINDLSPTTTQPFPVTPPTVGGGDYTPPVAPLAITIATPSTNTTWSRRKSLPISATATPGPNGLKSITLKADSRTIATCTTTTCSTNWNARNSSTGSHTITAIATDTQSQTTNTTVSITLTR